MSEEKDDEVRREILEKLGIWCERHRMMKFGLIKNANKKVAQNRAMKYKTTFC